MPTDITERGLERRICETLSGSPCDPPAAPSAVSELQAGYGGVGWVCGNRHDYDREYCVDLAQLAVFLRDTQPEIAAALALDEDTTARRQFLARLEGEISRRGVVYVLRHGVKHQSHHIDLFYGTPSAGNEQAQARFQQNRFSVVRQLGYSKNDSHNALDMAMFINGLPIFTFELKNNLTRQTADDAIWQYKKDRSPREKLFAIGRCIAHFAVDESEVYFCTKLAGKASWFLPFNRGHDNGAGNPPNPNGIKTDYLWREVLTRESLTNIIENYAQLVEATDPRTGRKTKAQIWPRYHQLDVVRKLLADVAAAGVGKRYLIQHSAGSGKSNSIAWLAHQLIGLQKDGTNVFESILVVTDRRILDRQICETIKQYAQVSATVGHAGDSGDLRKFIEEGKKVIISTVQKFPFILDEIGNQHRGKNFAIIIDEAHSSQGGKTTAAMGRALGEANQADEDETFEDQVNRAMEARKLLSNASYFAFTATPKNRTLEIFGAPAPPVDGKVRHLPFHSYTMKQAIQEGFIMDVLQHYTPVNSYYKLVKAVADDPEVDVKKARKQLRRYVEEHDYAISCKAAIMVEHFYDQVFSKRKIGGEARAMVVTSSVNNAIQYFHAIRYYLKKKGDHQAIVAFSGERDYGGKNVTETSLNGFPSRQIAEKIREDPYRFLICADKFQTGYDEPLLHTMYVDKILSDIKAVQTLSRLNRARPQKSDVFILDFANEIDTIRESFADYYQTTILAEETDPNKLHDLKADLDGYQIYSPQQVEAFARLYLSGSDRDKLDPILDECIIEYGKLDEVGQVQFKKKAKLFLRTYDFLSAVLTYKNAEWETCSILLNFLVRRLPHPTGDDPSPEIFSAIDMDSYRAEKQAMQKILLPDEDAVIDPVPTSEGGGSDSEKDRLSNVIKQFNEIFGGIDWADQDRVARMIAKDIPEQVSKDKAYQNARNNSDEQNARIEHDKALGRIMINMLNDDAELYKQFYENQDFRAWMTNQIFHLTYDQRQDSRAE